MELPTRNTFRTRKNVGRIVKTKCPEKYMMSWFQSVHVRRFPELELIILVLKWEHLPTSFSYFTSHPSRLTDCLDLGVPSEVPFLLSVYVVVASWPWSQLRWSQAERLCWKWWSCCVEDAWSVFLMWSACADVHVFWDTLSVWRKFVVNFFLYLLLQLLLFELY